MTETETSAARMEELKTQAREAFDDLKTRAQGGYEKASQAYQDTVRRVKSTTLADVKTTVVNYVKDHPIKAASIFLSVGAVVGALVMWRRK